jgi:hypothetical protein
MSAALVTMSVVGALHAQPRAAAKASPERKAEAKAARIVSPEDDPVSPGGDPVVYATRRHLASTQYLLKEMKNLNNQAYHSGMVIKWYETYATKIDELPMEDVDEEALKYSMALSGKLRLLASSQRGSNIRVNLLDSYTRTNVWIQNPSLYWDWWYFDYQPGFIAVESNAADVQTAKATVAASGREDRAKIWQSIETDTAEVRRVLAAKYRTSFVAAK